MLRVFAGKLKLELQVFNTGTQETGVSYIIKKNGITQIAHKRNEMPHSTWIGKNVSKELPYEFLPKSIKMINSLGMIDKEYDLMKPEGVFRVIFLGDSVTGDGKYTEILEKKLDEHSPGRFEIWNCGVGGYGIVEYEKYLRLKTNQYDYDMVCVGLTLNDFAPPAQPIRLMNGKYVQFERTFRSKVNINYKLYYYSYLYRFIVNQLVSLINPKDIYKYEYKVGRKALLKMQKLLKTRNKPFLVILFPVLTDKSEETSEYSLIKEIIDESGIEYLDLHKSIQPDERAKYMRDEYDIVHPNIEGDKRIASILFEYFKNIKEFNK